MMNLSLVCAADHVFEIRIVKDLFENVMALDKAIDSRNALLVTTPRVADLYSGCLEFAIGRLEAQVHILVLKLDERSKTMESVLRVCSAAADRSIDRRGVLIAFGGGVCSDIVGFAASILRRGTSYIRVPTTLVAQIDAGVGLKCGVNHECRKNFLGAFHPPDTVLVDHALLTTLPCEEIRQGVAEMIKIALVRDRSLFNSLEACGPALARNFCAVVQAQAEQAMRRSIELMLEELGANPYENRSLARLVDFGHSFSPMLESASSFALSHGDAVAVDIALSSLIATELGMIQVSETERILALLSRCGLPLTVPWLTPELARRSLDSVSLHRGNMLNLVVPDGIGRGAFIARREGLPDDVLLRSIERLNRLGVREANLQNERIV